MDAGLGAVGIVLGIPGAACVAMAMGNPMGINESGAH